jgi:hypothetical protein
MLRVATYSMTVTTPRHEGGTAMKTPIVQCAMIVALVVGPAFRHSGILPGQAPGSKDPLA